MKKKNVLIIASGGREHAIGWKLRQSKQIGNIYFAPGNAGTANVGSNTGIKANDFDSLVQFAKENAIYLTVAGPDDILSAGIVNIFNSNGLRIFGPTKEAAQIESSKAFAKQLMQEEHIPTAKYKSFTSFPEAKDYVEKQGVPIVIKASGLALGKGVVIAQTMKDAVKALENCMISKIFGASGEEVVIEEFLQGPEVSIHAFSDGKDISVFPPSRDHKTIFEDNRGPNTGGMGTITPLPEITKKQMHLIEKTIIKPIINGLYKRGIPFTGCLYPGLIMTKDGPKVIEFNCRFGDPETESYMRILKTDLLDIFDACVNETLANTNIVWENTSACCIILASKGYPSTSQKEIPIKGLEKTETREDIAVFHCATKEIHTQITTNGGRVLGITATGNTLDAALHKAYKVIGNNGIHFDGMHYRKDIGKSK